MQNIDDFVPTTIGKYSAHSHTCCHRGCTKKKKLTKVAPQPTKSVILINHCIYRATQYHCIVEKTVGALYLLFRCTPTTVQYVGHRQVLFFVSKSVLL